MGTDGVVCSTETAITRTAKIALYICICLLFLKGKAIVLPFSYFPVCLPLKSVITKTSVSSVKSSPGSSTAAPAVVMLSV